MNNTSLEELLQLSFQSGLAEIYTCLPCRITNIPNNLTDLRVDVEPVIKTKYSDSTDERHSQILGVPVVFPSGRTSLISFPLFVGDTVLCVFSQQGLDNFKQGNGTVAMASDFRRLDSRDAIAIPGMVPFGMSLNNPDVRFYPHNPADLVVAHNIATGTEVEIRLKMNGDVVVNTAQNVIMNCANATLNCDTSTVNSTTSTVNTSTAELACTTASVTASTMTFDVGDTVWNGNVSYTGTITLNGIPFASHKHTGVSAGPNVSGGPTA